MRITDRPFNLTEDGLIGRRKGQYWRRQAGNARKKSLKWIMRSIGIQPTKQRLYFLLKRLNVEDIEVQDEPITTLGKIPSYRWGPFSTRIKID